MRMQITGVGDISFFPGRRASASDIFASVTLIEIKQIDKPEVNVIIH
jgi:hypothetical protein